MNRANRVLNLPNLITAGRFVLSGCLAVLLAT
ncbi:MAG TPA: CDP-diacylglycerol--glycerol-3-phosphate 3-phosphatidyltransferase, partial [Desulfobulbus sp.]|nr:CDP-diacylglycerol--glycerol-3-phosphate 3-phosphatidyltransferase [Desulfobulbus sp.]